MKNWLDRTPAHGAGPFVSDRRRGGHLARCRRFARHGGRLCRGARARFPPFAGGIALAYVLDIPTPLLCGKTVPRQARPRPSCSPYLTFIVVLAAVIGLILPQLVQSISTFVNALPGYLDSAAAASLGAPCSSASTPTQTSPPP